MDSDCCLKREIQVPTICDFSGRSSSSYSDVSLSSSVAFLAFKNFSGYIRFSSLYTSCESGTSKHTNKMFQPGFMINIAGALILDLSRA